MLPASHPPSLLLSLLYSLLLPILPSFLLQTAGSGAFLQPGRTKQGVGRDELLMGGVGVDPEEGILDLNSASELIRPPPSLAKSPVSRKCDGKGSIASLKAIKTKLTRTRKLTISSNKVRELSHWMEPSCTSRLCCLSSQLAPPRPAPRLLGSAESQALAVVFQSLSHIQLFASPWTVKHQA